jgi:hypothetical protein
MKIRFRQTGGFAGLVKSVELDTEQMPAADAEVLNYLVQQADVFEVSISGGRSMPDGEQYMLFVESDGRSRNLNMGMGTIPAQLKPLIDYVAKQATYEKRK